MKPRLAVTAALCLASLLPAPAAAQQIFVNMVALEEGEVATYRALQEEAAVFWSKHDIGVLGRFAVTASGGPALGPVDHVEVFRVDDMANFRAYVSDPGYQTIRDSRPTLRARTIVMSGPLAGLGVGAPDAAPVVAVSYHDLGDADRAVLAAADDAAADILAQSGAVLLADLDVNEPRESQGTAIGTERAVDVVRVWAAPRAETVAALLASAP